LDKSLLISRAQNYRSAGCAEFKYPSNPGPCPLLIEASSLADSRNPLARSFAGDRDAARSAVLCIYAQPTFASTGRNARVEIIKDIRLCVKSLGNGDVLEFQANTYGAFSKKPSETEARYNLLSDAGPPVIAPGEERAPLVKFEPEHPQNKFFFAPGQYQVTLTAEREIAGKQLRKTVVLEALSADDIEKMNAIQQNQRHIPLEVLQTLSDANNPCSG
jgi:hypothetical protein